MNPTDVAFWHNAEERASSTYVRLPTVCGLLAIDESLLRGAKSGSEASSRGDCCMQSRSVAERKNALLTGALITN